MMARGRLWALLGFSVVVAGLGWSGYTALAEDTPAGPAQTDLSPQYPDFSEFQVLIDRNIFDSTRKAGATPGKEDATQSNQQVIVLSGTVIQGNKARALFEGSVDAPPEGMKPGDSVAGYRIAEVRTDGVTLSNDQGTIRLPVGGGLAKKEDGSWTPVDNPVPEAPAEAAQSSDAGQQTSPADKESDDAAERLRERRRKELGP